MKEKNIQPLVSVLIVLAVFCVFLFVILQGQQTFNKQLTASVFQPNCLSNDNAYKNFEQSWNQECEELGLEDRCSLPRDIADELKKEYQDIKQECQK